MFNATKVVVVAALAFMAGCGANDPSEQIQSTAEALNETGCETVTADVSGETPNTEVTSPNGSYDHGSSCPDQYVVEYDTTSSHVYVPQGGWSNGGPGNSLNGAENCANDGNAITETTCPNALLSVGAYGWNGTSWTVLNSGNGQYTGGTWYADQPTGGCFGGDLPAHCAWSLKSGYTWLSDTGYTGYTKIRVAVRAFQDVSGVVTDEIANVDLDDITIQ
jgi:hypothetical protein